MSTEHSYGRYCLTRRQAITVMGALATPALQAQTKWTPSNPIRLIVPYAAGGGTDVLARLVAANLGSSLGQPVVVENKPGVNGILGANYVFSAPPDGTTLLFAAADFISVAPHIYRKAVKFDPNGFSPVALIARMGFVLAAKTTRDVSRLQEMVGQAKNKEISYAHWGPGSMAQMGMEMLRAREPAMKVLPIPYLGAAPVMNAVMSGDVDYAFVPMPLAIASRSKLKLLGVASPERFPAISDVPTLTELGYRVDADTWFGVLAPPKTQSMAVEALQTQIARAMKEPQVQARLVEMGYVASPLEGASFGRFVRSENSRWGDVVRAANIRIEE